MTTTKTRQDVIDEIRDEIHAMILADLRSGANDYAAVRVWPNLDVIAVREPSHCTPESEYFGRDPHCVTVWSTDRMREPAGREDGVFEWDEASESDDGAFFADGQWWTMSDRLVDNLDMSDVMAEAERRLDDAGQPWWDELA